jgi:hypothetical protein
MNTAANNMMTEAELHETLKAARLRNEKELAEAWAKQPKQINRDEEVEFINLMVEAYQEGKFNLGNMRQEIANRIGVLEGHVTLGEDHKGNLKAVSVYRPEGINVAWVDSKLLERIKGITEFEEWGIVGTFGIKGSGWTVEDLVSTFGYTFEVHCDQLAYLKAFGLKHAVEKVNLMAW